ncbi:MAG: sulfurtransferase complex subunit TusD [Pseudomonadales bacterium]|nr:sulfurtransferase complex subunit TusD [Pseudomonadales bacterium]
MKISLNITAAPYSNQAHLTALKFAEAIAETEHQLARVFFSGDAVYVGNSLRVPPQGEEDFTARWIDVANAQNAELILCVSASLKRGMLDKTEADRYEKGTFNITSPFIISGLGQLVEAGIESDRLITFGG